MPSTAGAGRRLRLSCAVSRDSAELKCIAVWLYRVTITAITPYLLSLAAVSEIAKWTNVLHLATIVFTEIILAVATHTGKIEKYIGDSIKCQANRTLLGKSVIYCLTGIQVKT